MFVLSWLISLVQRSVQRPLRSGCPRVADGAMEKRAASVILRSCQVLDTVQCASLIRPRLLRSLVQEPRRLFQQRSRIPLRQIEVPHAARNGCCFVHAVDRRLSSEIRSSLGCLQAVPGTRSYDSRRNVPPVRRPLAGRGFS